jgi:endonuclease/exonuclease/phosphatase family metal-dependent hydrolase
MRQIFVRSLLALALVAPLPTTGAPAAPPDLLAFEELVALYEQEPPSKALAAKLDALRRTPFVDNSAWERGARPRRPDVAGLGPVLRVAQWNIERGLELDAVVAALRGPKAFAEIVDPKAAPPSSELRETALEQSAHLADADVIVLNEVDWGLKRSDYKNVAREVATALGMNYAYGVEFVEVDPLTLGTEEFADADETERAELVRNLDVDRGRTRGLHGTAILSRYKLENVRVVPFRKQGHDWYAGELESVAPLEKGKRAASDKVFLEKVLREVRRGGRMTLYADLVDESFPSGRVTIVATHLESKAKPSERRAQLVELLATIRRIENPVVLAGDMNTTGSDATPTSAAREVRKRLGSAEFWAARGLKWATGVGLIYDVTLGGVTAFRKQSDPTVRSIWLFSSNKEAKFFDTLEDFRFADGGAFDFRGDEQRSSNGLSGTLANSNERARKGFRATFDLEKTYGGIGKMKLDWIFVKPPDTKRSYLFAPHHGRTMKELNIATGKRISDHKAISVDLPLREPAAPGDARRVKVDPDEE